MKKKVCPKCNERPFSVLDRSYLEENSQCWDCDFLLWKDKKISNEEFDRREYLAERNMRNS